MKFLSGKISDVIRGGKLPKDVAVLKYERPGLASDQPGAKSVRGAEGHGLGSGATRRRSGPGAS